MCINPIKINGKQFPCGKCVECSKAYQNSLAIRCTEEAKDWKHTYMITLTYDDEHLPTKRVNPYMVRYCDEGEVKTTYFSSLESAKSFVKRHDIILDAPIINVFEEVSSYLNEINNPKANAPYQSQELLSGKRAIKFPTQRKGDFQRFMKSLRKSLEREGKGERVKYLFSSEYGDNTWRPHYHAILFTNLPFETVKPLVDHYWTMGFIECHEVSEVYKGSYVDKQAAFMYASKYIVKYYKLLLDKSDIAKVYLSNTYLSNNYIKIKCGIYTYQQLKDAYESYLLDTFGIKWNNRVIGKYFPEHIKKDVHKNRITQKMYIFKKEL